MKKFVVFLIIVIIIVCIISYMYLNSIAARNIAISENKSYESYIDREIFGSTLASVINKAVSDNQKNNVEKDSKGFYKGNDENSIKIQVKITDNDTLYDMETFYNGGMENFIQYYNEIYFECTRIDYNSLGKVRYVLFEQRTT